MKPNLTHIVCWVCAAAAGVGVFLLSDPAASSSLFAERGGATAPDDVYDDDEWRERQLLRTAPALPGEDRSGAAPKIGEYREILCLLPRIFFAPGDDGTTLLGLGSPDGKSMLKNLAETAKSYRETAVLQNTFTLLKLGGSADGGGSESELAKNLATIARLYRQAGDAAETAPPDGGDAVPTLGELMKRYRQAAETGTVGQQGL